MRVPVIVILFGKGTCCYRFFKNIEYKYNLSKVHTIVVVESRVESRVPILKIVHTPLRIYAYNQSLLHIINPS